MAIQDKLAVASWVLWMFAAGTAVLAVYVADVRDNSTGAMVGLLAAVFVWQALKLKRIAARIRSESDARRAQP